MNKVKLLGSMIELMFQQVHRRGQGSNVRAHIGKNLGMPTVGWGARETGKISDIRKE